VERSTSLRTTPCAVPLLRTRSRSSLHAHRRRRALRWRTFSPAPSAAAAALRSLLLLLPLGTSIAGAGPRPRPSLLSPAAAAAAPFDQQHQQRRHRRLYRARARLLLQHVCAPRCAGQFSRPVLVLSARSGLKTQPGQLVSVNLAAAAAEAVMNAMTAVTAPVPFFYPMSRRISRALWCAGAV
jgi:predicted small lipoprotein YifL